MAKYDIFSKRHKKLPDVYQYDGIPEKLRNQIRWIWLDTLAQFGYRNDLSGKRIKNDQMRHIQQALCREHGVRFLCDCELLAEGDLMAALVASSDTLLVLDIIEFSFRTIQQATDYHHMMLMPAAKAIEELNYRFRENGVGYEYNADSQQIIRIDNQLIHQEAVQPALHILSAPEFATANDEFLEAFDDYKKHDYDDCLTKCCSAFESVMKIVCEQNGWTYSPKDTAGKLVQTLIEKADIPSYFKDVLLIIATLRNRLSKSHGAGTEDKHVPDHLARYSLHATASAIVLVVDVAT